MGSEEKICLRKMKWTVEWGVYRHSHLLSCYEIGIQYRLCMLGRTLALGRSSSGLLIPLWSYKVLLPVSLLYPFHPNVWVYKAWYPGSEHFRAARMPSMALGGDPVSIVCFSQAGDCQPETEFLVCLWMPEGRVLWKSSNSSRQGNCRRWGALGWCGSQLLTM